MFGFQEPEQQYDEEIKPPPKLEKKEGPQPLTGEILTFVQRNQKRAQLLLVCQHKTVYGPELLASLKTADDKVMLSFKPFLTRMNIEIKRVELYNDAGNFIWVKEFEKALIIKRGQTINFWFEIQFNSNLTWEIK